MVLIFSEWVLGNREDLVKDIVEELQTENGEVRLSLIFFNLVISSLESIIQ